MSSSPYEPGVSGIEVHDPGFRMDGFLAAAAQTVHLYGRAFFEGRPELISGVLGPDLAAGVAASIEGLAARGVRLAPDDGSAELRSVAVRSDGAGDTITVVVASTWREMTEAGIRHPQRRLEKWAFWRAASATTAQPADVTPPPPCRHCGAPFDPADGPAPACRFCHVAAPILPWLWVVARIELS